MDKADLKAKAVTRKRKSLAGIVKHLAICGMAMLISTQTVVGDVYTFTVASDTSHFKIPAGESQSAVVAPGKKGQCPNGRIFVTDETKHPLLASVGLASQAINTVHWRNLAGTKNIFPNEGHSLFSSPPEVTISNGQLKSHRAKLWVPVTFDHQLVALPNGDLIYQRAVASREPIDPKPIWWDLGFRNDFGPGARTTLATWRSKDCGETFEYLSEIDSFGAGSEDCASPRLLGVDSNNKPLIDLGGSDGPNLVVDKNDGTAYAAFPCVGNKAIKDAQGKVSLTEPINKTYVFSLKSGAKTFINRGAYNPNLWGPTLVPLTGNRLAVGLSGIGPASLGGIMIGHAKSSTGQFVMDKPIAVDDITWGWAQPPVGFPYEIPLKTGLRKHVFAIIAANTVLAPVPGKTETVLLAFPAVVEKTEGKPETKTQGFRVYYYHPKNVDPKTSELVRTDGIVPTGPAQKSMIMHLTAIDPGDGGPILLYWYDLNGASNTARIRGRFIYADTGENTPSPDSGAFTDLRESEEFDIALTGGQTTPFNLDSGSSYWFGDYKTAGGFRNPKVTEMPFATIVTYRYYPMWIQPDGTINYTEITATRTILKPTFKKRLSREPLLRIFTECCGFAPLLERTKAEKGVTSSGEQLPGEARTLASMLFKADPNLNDTRLRILTKREVSRRAQPAISTTLEQSPAMRNIFREHEENVTSRLKPK
jgi:hypothetical protein